MSDLLETLRQEGVDPALLAAVEEYRAAHPLAEALRENGITHFCVTPPHPGVGLYLLW